MNLDACFRSLLRRPARALAFVLGSVLLLGAGGPVLAAAACLPPFCATPVPGGSTPPSTNDRWNASSSLRPAAIMEDSTWYDGDSDPVNGNVRRYYTVDIENGILFAATGQGLKIFDVRGGPTTEALSYLWGGPNGGNIPGWGFLGDGDWYVKHLDAPEGNTGVVALAMNGQGFAVARTTNLGTPIVSYVRKVLTSQVYSVRASGTDWAYALGQGGQIHRFNLTAASAMNGCLETPPVTSCPNAYMGLVTSLGAGSGTLHGVDRFLATGNWLAGGPVKIWSLADPAAPSLVLQINGAAAALAMWKSGGSYYLARIDASKKLTIHDVSCIAGGACSSAPEVWSKTLTAPVLLTYVTVSQDSGRTYLYVGNEDAGSCVAQREYIFDVTSPATASHEDLTPKIHSAGYWGWYYKNCSTGFNGIAPFRGKVHGGYLYRAAHQLLDAHQIGFQDSPPTANFASTPVAPATEIYPGTPVQFTDLSSGSPTQWAWSFEGGTPSPGSTVNSQHPKVTFATPGQKTVRLEVTNSFGSDTDADVLTVLNPAPQLTGVDVSPANPIVCQPVTMAAVNPIGQPPLQYQWTVEDAAGGSVFQTNGNTTSQVWNTTGVAAGTYTASLTLSGAGTPVTRTKVFTLGPLPPLAANSAPTFDPFAAGTVTFHVNASGATEWNWDFDGDGIFRESDWTNDPVNGPNPTHTYTATGTRQVRVKVRNCENLAGVVSPPVTVDITQITQLEAKFSIISLCGGGSCLVDAGQEVMFRDQSVAAEAWWFDWNGDNTFEQGPLGPSAFTADRKIGHIYTTQGTYKPKLKVTRGTEQKIYTLPQQIVVGPSSQTPSSITISGPTTGQMNQPLTFSASGSGSCNPNANGWSWSLAGGIATGSVTTNTVTVSWSAAGSKSISATNSSCGSTSDSHLVSIAGSGTGGSALKADFTFSPTAPVAGQAVGFNGGISQGSPEGYTWDFRDGTALVTGVQVSHTFAQPGTYRVELSVAKTSTQCAPAPFCQSTVIKLVVVGGNSGPPLVAGFNSDICSPAGGVCSTTVNQAVTFTDSSTGNIISRAWDFGDGETATGTTVTHVYDTPGNYQLTLTVSDGTQVKNLTRTIVVGGVLTESMLLPWVGKAKDGPLVQSSDLYLHNPSAGTINVSLDFIQRGNVGDLPPVKRAIEPNSTLFVADVVKNMFGLDNMTGFLEVKIDEGNVQPVLISFNTTVRSNGEFGQTIPGFTQSNTGAAASTGNNQVQHLVGLNDNGERLAYFGFSNAGASQVSYNLRFFNDQGAQVGRGETLTLGPLSAKQFQSREIRERFGLTDLDDYRVLVETPRNARLFPYGANVRIGSGDPSFLTVGSGAARTYLLGALSTPGANNSVWQSDLVLANTGSQVVIADISFTNVGATSQSTDVIRETLQPGETRRLADVIGTKWNIRNGVGVLTIDSNAPGSQYPVIQGESYENTTPAKRYGQTLPSLTDAQAAGSGKGQYLVGLREDSKYRTTFWMFNPSTDQGQYDIIFRNLQGDPIHRLDNVVLGPGKLRQLNKAQFPTVTGSFTVQVLVKSGKALTAAQVVNNVTNDPAYVQGETR